VHRCGDDQEDTRVHGAGGFVHRSRVNGVLAVTRALGDHGVACDGVVSAEPDVKAVVLGESDEFVICATDGLWDAVGEHEAVGLAEDCFDHGMDTKAVADELVRVAIEAGSTDNITVSVVLLDQPS
jgi:serine/threonine protein phosphatase PrpC